MLQPMSEFPSLTLSWLQHLKDHGRSNYVLVACNNALCLLLKREQGMCSCGSLNFVCNIKPWLMMENQMGGQSMHPLGARLVLDLQIMVWACLQSGSSELTGTAERWSESCFSLKNFNTSSNSKQQKASLFSEHRA